MMEDGRASESVYLTVGTLLVLRVSMMMLLMLMMMTKCMHQCDGNNKCAEIS